MARVNYGHGISSLSGKVGGVVHSLTTYSPVMRSSPRTVVQSSSSQQSIRSIVATASKLWSQLSDSNRAEWASYATYYASWPTADRSRQLSAYNTFLEITIGLLLAGRTPITTPGWDSVQYVCPQCTLDIFGTGFWIEFDDTPPASDHYLLISATPCLSPGRTCVTNRLRRLETPTTPSHSYNLTSAWLAKYGSLPTIGLYVTVSYSFIDVSSGIRTNTVTIRQQVTEES